MASKRYPLVKKGRAPVLPLWWRLFMLVYRGWAIGFAVLAPLFGMALALNHELDLASAFLVIVVVPIGCVGMYYFSRWMDRRAESARKDRDAQPGRF